MEFLLYFAFGMFLKFFKELKVVAKGEEEK